MTDWGDLASATLPDRLPEPLFLGATRAALAVEYRQLRDEGRNLAGVESEFEAALAAESVDPGVVAGLLDAGRDLPLRDDYPYEEPTGRAAVEAACPDGPALDAAPDRETASEAIHGGWLGSCAGCLLGKPTQGWTRERVLGFLRDSGQYPVAGYLTADVDPGVAEEYRLHENVEDTAPYVERVHGMPVDDDIDYVAVGLEVLQAEGGEFTATDVADHWLQSLPLFDTYTAERAAYRNLANRVTPPESAVVRNPYREMVGALIRADPWGYAALGDPARAATYAHRDARVSHVKNGVYGERWAAAMVAAAPFAESVADLLGVGLAQVPERSRFAEAVRDVRTWHREGLAYEAAVDRVHDRWDDRETYDWVHVLSNAQVVALALLYGDGEFTASLRAALQAGFDTDSHGATVGAVLGARLGPAGIPDDWLAPLEDTVETSLPGRGRESISGLAEETTAVWDALR